MHAVRLAIILTAWDSFASVGGIALAHWARKAASKEAACLWLSAAIAALGYFAAPFVLFPWNEAHSFHHVMDCSCFFTEGYEIMFPLLAAPILILGTFVREALTQRMLTRHARGEMSE